MTEQLTYSYTVRTYVIAQGTLFNNSVMAYMGKEAKSEWIYVYVQLIHFAVYLKLTPYYKLTVLQ